MNLFSKRKLFLTYPSDTKFFFSCPFLQCHHSSSICVFALVVCSRLGVYSHCILASPVRKVHRVAVDPYTYLSVWCVITWSPSVFAVAGQAPVVSVDPRTATVRQGESVSFRCNVGSGAQPAGVEWKRANNQPLPGHQ